MNETKDIAQGIRLVRFPLELHQLDVDQILSADKDLVLAIEDVGLTGDYHVVVGLYVEGGGQFQPVSGTDYLATSEKLTFGDGPVQADLELAIYTE